jgi:hypothetical protein
MVSWLRNLAVSYPSPASPGSFDFALAYTNYVLFRSGLRALFRRASGSERSDEKRENELNLSLQNKDQQLFVGPAASRVREAFLESYAKTNKEISCRRRSRGRGEGGGEKGELVSELRELPVHN